MGTIRAGHTIRQRINREGKGKLPDTREEYDFNIKQEAMRQKRQKLIMNNLT